MVEAARGAVTVIVRRPHAYRFATDHEGAKIPGIVVLDADGGVLGALALPADDAAAIADLIRGK